MMTEMAVCARCQVTFERECVELENGDLDCSAVLRIEETEPVCEDCEHEFLAWTTCPPIV